MRETLIGALALFCSARSRFPNVPPIRAQACVITTSHYSKASGEGSDRRLLFAASADDPNKCAC